MEMVVASFDVMSIGGAKRLVEEAIDLAAGHVEAERRQ
jgi:hypothetical protein